MLVSMNDAGSADAVFGLFFLMASSVAGSEEFVAPRRQDRKETRHFYFSELGVLCVFARVSFSLARPLVPRRGHDFGDGPSRRAELDRNHARIADDFTTELANLRYILVEVINFNGKMMNARSRS